MGSSARAKFRAKIAFAVGIMRALRKTAWANEAGNLHGLVGGVAGQQQVVPRLHHPSEAHEQATGRQGEVKSSTHIAVPSEQPVDTQRASHICRNHFGRLVHVGQATKDNAPIRHRAPEMRGFWPYFRIPESEEDLRRMSVWHGRMRRRTKVEPTAAFARGYL